MKKGQTSVPTFSKLCLLVPTFTIVPTFFKLCLFLPTFAMCLLLQMYTFAPNCPTFTNVYFCPNLSHFSAVLHLCKCIVVSQCAPLSKCAQILLMHICA